MKWNQWKTWIQKNKLLILFVATGIILLAVPISSKNQKSEQNSVHENLFSVQEEEKRLEKILSEMRGAGKVSVMLSLKDYGEVTLAENRQSSRSDGGEENESEVVVLSDSDRNESPAVLRNKLPEYQGAVVVATGADNAQVRLKITQAVQSVTGLGSDRITVIQ